MLLPLLLPLLWTLLPAWAGPCAVLQVDSTITWKVRGDRAGQRSDHLLLRAEDSRPDCARLRVPDLPHSRLTGLRATVQRAESRALRLGAERLVPTEGGWILHLPELSEGAVLRLDLDRDLLEPWTLWAPAWRGAPEWTRLRVKNEGDRLPVDALGPAA